MYLVYKHIDLENTLIALCIANTDNLYWFTCFYKYQVDELNKSQ